MPHFPFLAHRVDGVNSTLYCHNNLRHSTFLLSDHLVHR
jgi:hypothetical protein